MILHIFIIMFFVLLAAIIFPNFEHNFNKKLYLWIAFSLLFFLSAFRSIEIGNDTSYYVNMYKYYGNSSNFVSISYLFSFENIINSRIEPGYVLLNMVLNIFSKEYILLFIVTSLFILGTWKKHIQKNSEIVWLSVLLFFNLRFFYFTLSGLRQAIAMSIILISYEHLKKRNLKLFVMQVLIASVFHLSALVFLIAYPLTKWKINFKIVGIYFLIASLGYLSFDKILNLLLPIFPKYQMYLSSSYLDGNIRTMSIMNFLIAFVISIFGMITTKKIYKYSKSLYNKDENFDEINVLNNIVLVSAVVAFISIKASIIGRFHIYFFMFTVIYIPKALKLIKNNDLRTLMTFIIVILFILYNLIILYYRPEWQNVYPYRFIWDI